MARVTTGRLCDVRWINTIFIYQFGTLLVGFVTLVLPVIQSYKGIAIFVVFYGLGDGIFITTMNSLLMFTVDEKRRAAALGLGNTLLSIGVAAGPPLAGEQAWAILFHIYIYIYIDGAKGVKHRLQNTDRGGEMQTVCRLVIRVVSSIID